MGKALTQKEKDKIWNMVKTQHEIEMAFSNLPTDEQGNLEKGDIENLGESLAPTELKNIINEDD